MIRLQQVWFLNAIRLDGKNLVGSCRVVDGPADTDVEEIQVEVTLVRIKTRRHGWVVTSSINIRDGKELVEDVQQKKR